MLRRHDTHPYILGEYLGTNHASVRFVGKHRVWKQTSRTELEILQTLQAEGANIAPTLLDTYMIGTDYFMIQPYYPYRNLHELCIDSTVFPLSDTQWSALYDTCSVLYGDFEIDHGDLIPSNILFGDDRFCLIDFEYARNGEGDSLLLEHAMCTLRSTMVKLLKDY